MKQFLKPLSVACLAILFSTSVMAKLPAVSDEAKAKAAEASAKTAWSGKMDGYQLCKSQDKVVAHYKKSKPGVTSSCIDPGPFIYTPVNAAGVTPATSSVPAALPAPTAAPVPNR